MILFVNNNSGILFLAKSIVTAVFREIHRAKSYILKRIVYRSKI